MVGWPVRSTILLVLNRTSKKPHHHPQGVCSNTPSTALPVCTFSVQVISCSLFTCTKQVRRMHTLWLHIYTRSRANRQHPERCADRRITIQISMNYIWLNGRINVQTSLFNIVVHSDYGRPRRRSIISVKDELHSGNFVIFY